jgi:hypothetical protein
MKTSFVKALSFWVLPGLIAGAVFLAIALITGPLATTVWGMPDAIARVIGIAAPAGYSFAPVPVVVGVAVHLALSIVLGALFTALARWLRLRGWKLVVASAIFISIETPIALWVVMHNLLPAATFSFFLSAIPWWGSVLGHYMYALILGLLLARNPAVAAWKTRQPASKLEARA